MFGVIGIGIGLRLGLDWDRTVPSGWAWIFVAGGVISVDGYGDAIDGDTSITKAIASFPAIVWWRGGTGDCRYI